MANSGQNLADLAGQIRRMQLELASADLPCGKRAALQQTAEEALRILKSEETRQRRQRPSRRVSQVAGEFYRKSLTAALLLTRIARFVTSRALWFCAMVFLVHFGLEFFPHPAKWNQWGWVVRLNELLTPVLAGIDSALEWPEAVPFYPFVLGFVLMVASIVVDNKLARACAWLRKKQERKAKAEAPCGGLHPISWLRADQYAALPLGRAALVLRDPHSSW